MESPFNTFPKFETPEEELSFLREHVRMKEAELQNAGIEKPKEQITSEALRAYSEVPKEKVLSPKTILPEKEADQIVLRLAPESHDTKMEELLGVLLSKGIKNALSLVEKMNNPHIDDDFHRFLVQYIHSVGTIPGLKEKTPLWESIHMKLFEISLPENGEDDKRSFKELLSAMEQFYAGMQSVGDGRDNYGKHYFTLEIALSSTSNEVVFYACVPDSKSDLLEKQLLGVHPNAKIIEVADDYNIFNESGNAAGGAAVYETHEVFPIKLYEHFDHDPLNIIINAFSKLKKEGEGAAIQLLIRPEGDHFVKSFNYTLEKVREGEKLKKSIFSEFDRAFAKEASNLIFGVSKKKEEEKKVDENAVKNITEKIKSTIVATNIRVITSAETKERAQEILREIESAFNQFSDPNSNALRFTTNDKADLTEVLHEFSYRLFCEHELLPMSFKELATIAHFPHGISSSPQLKQAKAAQAPAPMSLGNQGILLGMNSYRGIDTPIYMSREDRMRHFYVIGQTGTGKTTILKNMIVQDIQNGDGVCFIDPHGSDINDILACIPRERIDDVIYFDPAYTARPMGLNMLEFDARYPEQKTFVVDEMMSIFNKLFDMKTAGGPMFEQYFRNATLLVLEDTDSGSTLLDISRVLSDDAYREQKIARCKNPIVVQFWKNIASKAGGEASLANIVPYITSKFDVFMSNEIMRPIIAQQKSVFNMRQIMDEKKILLVNLSKGRLGEINANLIGLILVGKILMAALSRVDMFGTPMNDFYLYIDEFQNVTTNSISQILSEARKYRLSLNIAHQFIAQIDEQIKNSVFGNVGSMAVFRVGADDASYLESQFLPTFTKSDILKIDNYNAYLKMLVNGEPVKPFNIKTMMPPKGNPEITASIKELSYLKFGRDRAEIEDEIMKRYLG